MPTDPFASGILDAFRYLVPEMVLVAAACIVFLGGTWRSDRSFWGWATLGSFLLAGAALFWTRGLTPLTGEAAQSARYASPLLFDDLSFLTRILSLVGGIVLLLLSWNEVPERQAADHHACLLLVIAGAGLVGCSNDLVSLFLALEMISIPTYILLYLPRSDEQAQEAALKYFLLSVFASAITLFGFSYLYGLAGTTNISALFRTLNSVGAASDLPITAQIALIMVVAGMGARITAVPFHFYAPDVYQGTSVPGAALLAYVPKVAGFVALLRVLGFVLPDAAGEGGMIGLGLGAQTPILLWFLAAITMTLGNVLALLQDNVKRLLAYSSVAHAGYMLMGLAAAPYLRRIDPGSGPDGVQAVLFYLAAYGAMTIGAFAVLSYLSTRDQSVEYVDDIAGLSRNRPGVALLMSLFCFSLIGMPLTAGFLGKFMLFFGAVSVPAGHATLYRVLAVIAAVNAAIGGWYYLRLIAVMYLRNPLQPIETRGSASGKATLAICAVLTLGLSLPPLSTWMMGATRQAAGVPAPPPQGQVRAELPPR